MDQLAKKNVAVIIAHPDDETLWAGGTILSNPDWKVFVVCMSRKSDADRSVKFFKALQLLKVAGIMGDLDDGPDQKPLVENELQTAILDLLPGRHFDLIISHNPQGEYTRHLRHEEVGKAVINLWYSGKLTACELHVFAYEDDNKAYFPQAIANANVYHTLSKQVFQKKYSIITETYGFGKNSWEAQTTPKAEAFWQFTDPHEAKKWLNKFEDLKI